MPKGGAKSNTPLVGEMSLYSPLYQGPVEDVTDPMTQKHESN